MDIAWWRHLFDTPAPFGAGPPARSRLASAEYGDAMAGCMECGFDYELAQGTDFARLATPFVDSYVALLRSTSTERLQLRRSPQVWSALEYACHVRDMLLVQRERVFAARRRDRPVAEPMGRDDRVEHDGYNNQRPEDVARQLADATLLLSNALVRLSPADWERTVIYGYPERAERSLRWVAAHTLHELRHHLRDIRRQLD
jgi:hypothetical protein